MNKINNQKDELQNKLYDDIMFFLPELQKGLVNSFEVCIYDNLDWHIDVDRKYTQYKNYEDKIICSIDVKSDLEKIIDTIDHKNLSDLCKSKAIEVLYEIEYFKDFNKLKEFFTINRSFEIVCFIDETTGPRQLIVCNDYNDFKCNKCKNINICFSYDKTYEIESLEDREKQEIHKIYRDNAIYRNKERKCKDVD